MDQALVSRLHSSLTDSDTASLINGMRPPPSKNTTNVPWKTSVLFPLHCTSKDVYDCTQGHKPVRTRAALFLKNSFFLLTGLTSKAEEGSPLSPFCAPPVFYVGSFVPRHPVLRSRDT